MNSATRQNNVARWVESRFGPHVQNDRRERAMRVLEEAIELAQAIGISIFDAGKLVEHVYARPAGDADQELAGVGVTSLAMAQCLGIDLEEVIDLEIDRIFLLPPDHFKRRQQVKVDAGVACSMEAK